MLIWYIRDSIFKVTSFLPPPYYFLPSILSILSIPLIPSIPLILSIPSRSPLDPLSIPSLFPLDSLSIPSILSIYCFILVSEFPFQDICLAFYETNSEWARW